MHPAGVGDLLDGRYALLSLLGEGSGGAVYHARDQVLGIDVAVKLLFERFGEEQNSREAEIALALRHVGLVSSFSLQHDVGGSTYLVMELLTGGTLAQRVQSSGPLPVPDVINALRVLASALDYMHSQGILHRDIKPQNVLYSGAGEPKLMDFGIARPLARETTMTQDVGTHRYAAPEQLGGHPDERSDVFSLGAVGYFMLTGSAPPAAFERSAKFPVAGTTPIWLVALLKRCLSHNPAVRPQSAKDLLEQLAEGVQRADNVSRRQILVAGVATVLVISALVSLQHTREAVEIVAQPITALSRVLGLDLIEKFEGTGLRVGSRALYVEAAIAADDLASMEWHLASKKGGFSDEAMRGFLCSSIEARRHRMLEALLKRVTEFEFVCNDTLDSPLAAAIRLGDPEALELLLKAGADPNGRIGEANSHADTIIGTCDQALLRSFLRNSKTPLRAGRDGTPPIFRLMFLNCPVDTFRVFLAEGGAVNDQDVHGNTVVHYLINEPGDPRIDMVVKTGRFDLTLKNINDDTVFHHLMNYMKTQRADTKRMEELTRLFLEFGADPSAADKAGHTPAALAALRLAPSVLKIILDTDRVPLDYLDSAGSSIEHYARSGDPTEVQEKLALIAEARARLTTSATGGG